MDEHPEGEWLSYREAAERLGTTRGAVAKRAKRRGWLRRPGNRPGSETAIFVPSGALTRAQAMSPQADAIRRLSEAVERLTVMLAAERAERVEAQLQLVEAQRQLAEAQRALQQAQEQLAALRQQLEPPLARVATGAPRAVPKELERLTNTMMAAERRVRELAERVEAQRAVSEPARLLSGLAPTAVARAPEKRAWWKRLLGKRSPSSGPDNL
jgi:hypothetical protein